MKIRKNDIQFFVDFEIPYKISRDKVESVIKESSTLITIDEAMNAWYEHDALHYLFNQPFDINGETNVAYLEKTFKRGWLPFGKQYNTYKPTPFMFPVITQELITETAEQIKNFCDNL